MNSDIIIVQSASSQKYLTSKYRLPKNKFKLVPIGVNTGVFHPQTNAQKTNTLKTLNLPSDKKIVMYCGRIDPAKGVDRLIMAAGLLNQQTEKEVILLVVHFPVQLNFQDYYFRLKSLVSCQKIKVRFILSPPRRKLAKLYNISDCVVLPSIHETTPRAMLESLACGIPFIGTNTGNIPDVLGKITKRLILENNHPNTICSRLGYIFSLDESGLLKIRNSSLKVIKEDFSPKISRLSKRKLYEIINRF